MKKSKYSIRNDVGTENSIADNNHFWKFVATANEGGEAELILYGNIAQKSWWGDEITPKKFSDELAALGDISSLKIRINSGGGDVFAANAIYSRMVDLRKKGVKVTAVVDGWAASAATLVCMAAESIAISETGIFMIHNPKIGVCDYFEAKDLEKMKDELDTVKTAMLAAYTAKTGKKSEDVSTLLDNETWFDGAKAVEEGFCDELITVKVSALSNSGRVVVNSIDVGDLSKIPSDIAATLKKEATPQVIMSAGAIKNNKENVMDIKELTAKHPELVAQIEANERKRIQDIENAAVPGFEAIVQDAKFTNPISAGDLALRICNEQKKAGASFLSDAKDDVKSSGVNDVHKSEPVSTDLAADEEKQFEADLDAVYGDEK